MPPERLTTDKFNAAGNGYLPGHLDILVTEADIGELKAEFVVSKKHIAPNGYLHAGSVVALADTAAGYGCVAHLPEGGTGFTTLELKSNHMGTARNGTVRCHAKAVHLGKTTQVWDAIVSHIESHKIIAVFRCTQLILYAK